MEDNKEDFILKKIRHFQGTIEDYKTYWERKIAEGVSEESSETKSLKQRNDDLNHAFDIYPVEKD
jgi:hypothetical protein